MAQLELPWIAAAQHSIAKAMNHQPSTASKTGGELTGLPAAASAAETSGAAACLADQLSSSLLSIATAGHDRSENVLLKRGRRTGGMDTMSEGAESSSSQSGD